jgi:glycerate-2-kinase
MEEKQQLNRLLLGSGAGIGEINAVRKHLSGIKGGRLALRAAPASVINLTVSDVAGDQEDLITDPTVQDTTTVADAIRVLREYELWEEVAPSIREHLSSSPAAGSPDLSGVYVHTVMMITGETACAAMAKEADLRGFEPAVLATTLEGEGREVGKVLASVGRECFRKGRPFAPPRALLGCGGETTVTLAKDSDLRLGGPNQEVALAFALGLAPSDRIVGAFLDSDGADGGTGFAGAMVDGTTAVRAAELRLDIRGALRAHETSSVLKTLGDLVITGPTRTNVNDLFVIVIERR